MNSFSFRIMLLRVMWRPTFEQCNHNTLRSEFSSISSKSHLFAYFVEKFEKGHRPNRCYVYVQWPCTNLYLHKTYNQVIWCQWTLTNIHHWTFAWIFWCFFLSSLKNFVCFANRKFQICFALVRSFVPCDENHVIYSQSISVLITCQVT